MLLFHTNVAVFDPLSVWMLCRYSVSAGTLTVLEVGVEPELELEPELVEVDEVAAVLGVSRWSVYRWAERGRPIRPCPNCCYPRRLWRASHAVGISTA